LTLIESLVALVILALGVLGLAGVQTRVLVESRTTNSRAIAIGLIDDLNNRMLLNRDAAVGVPVSPGVLSAVASAYATQPIRTFLGAPTAATAIEPDPLDCRVSPNTPVICTPVQLAQYDLMAWRRAVAAAFPNGQVHVFNSAKDPRQIGIAIAWPANERSGADTTPGTAPFAINNAALGDAPCPANFICHIVYAQP
jgi:type IV pilus assembly protein PilV